MATIGSLKTHIIIRSGDDIGTTVAEVTTPIKVHLTDATDGNAVVAVTTNLRRYRRQMARVMLRLAWIFMTRRGT